MPLKLRNQLLPSSFSLQVISLPQRFFMEDLDCDGFSRTNAEVWSRSKHLLRTNGSKVVLQACFLPGIALKHTPLCKSYVLKKKKINNDINHLSEGPIWSSLL